MKLSNPSTTRSGLSRRSLIRAAGGAATITLGLGTTRHFAKADAGTIRIGFQKYGTLVLLKGRGELEAALEPLGFKVEWTEFPAGPQLLEGLNVGAIDFGSTGESPPIFAQAAGAPLLYVAHEPPAPRGEAILVPKQSAIQSVGELRGKKVALNKGSNVHYLLVKALEKAGVPYGEIEPVFLTPSDARAAFEKGAVEAWAIWDPFQAAAEIATEARTLTTGEGLVSNHQFYLAARPFAAGQPGIVSAVVKSIANLDAWANGNTDAVATRLSSSVGIPAEILKIALARQTYGVKSLDEAVVAEQQKIADTFHSLGLLKTPIAVSDAVWKVGS